jgi:hypothetical protein
MFARSLLAALLAAAVAGSHAFAFKGFVPAAVQLRSVCTRGLTPAPRASRRRMASLLVMYEGTVTTYIKRNFGETFFLEGAYENDFTKEWTYSRTYTDFVKLHREISKKYPDQINKLPQKPYLIGEESSFMPFQKYLEKVLSIPGAFEDPAVYEFVGTPADVITSAFKGQVPIDVLAEGGRYSGEKTETGKYVPTLDPVMMAEGAGKGVREAKEALEKAEISKKAGSFAADKANEWKEVAAPAVEEVKQKIAESGVSSQSTGKALGGILANLKSGRGLFGEEATMKAVQQVSSGIEEAMNDGAYTDQDKWDVTVTGSVGETLDVTVRPTQKARLLLKAWLADNEISESEAGAYSLEVNGVAVGGDEEIGQVMNKGGVVSVVRA